MLWCRPSGRISGNRRFSPSVVLRAFIWPSGTHTIDAIGILLLLFPLSWWAKCHSRTFSWNTCAFSSTYCSEHAHHWGLLQATLPWTPGQGAMAGRSPRFKSPAVQEELWLLISLLQNDRQHARELEWVSHFFLSQSDNIMALSARRMSQMWSSACSAQGLPASPASDGGCRQHWPSTGPFSLGFLTCACAEAISYAAHSL